MYNTKVKNMEIPENLFSNLGEMKSKKIEIPKEEKTDFVKEYQENNSIKLKNYSKHTEYRDRITKMYQDMDNIKPIDSEIDNILYFNNYIEKGIVVKPKVSSLKQFWTEYRLIHNEKNITSERENKELNNFEELFDALSLRISEINKYINELKEMKSNIDETSSKLEEEKSKLKEEKKEFHDYKQNEENKIKEEKENLKINFERLQTIIDDLDKKLGSIDNFETISSDN